jgi:3-hydroxyisobutyrate dehydrogenase-like beta-hydroxyacid dehydrogenase
MARVAVIGTGVIGGGMALNLLRHGHEVVVWNRSAERAADAVAAGAGAAATPASAVADADVVFEATADDASSRSVWLGEDGILAGSLESATLVTSATLSPGWVAELAAACRDAGRAFLDMPVTGGRAGAEGGTLVMLAGGERAALEAIDEVLAAVSSRVRHFGAVGSGTRFKLVLNALQAIHLVGFGEAMSLARAVGLDPDDVGPALVDRLGGPVTQMAWVADQHLPDRANFALSWALKDLRYASAMAVDVPAPMLDVAVTRLAAAAGEGWGDRDWTVANALLPGTDQPTSGRD